MRKFVERPFLIFVGLVSIALTALTVWAVWWQGEVLAQRELGDLQREARRAISLRAAEIRNAAIHDIERIEPLWHTRLLDELNDWAAEQTNWTVVCLAAPGKAAQFLPLTPLQSALPDPTEPAVDDSKVSEDTEDERGSAPTTTGPTPVADDPRTLLAVATVQQNLGRRRDAAQSYAEAARRLRETPKFGWMAFQADLAAIDCWLSEREVAAAQEHLQTLLAAVLHSELVSISELELAALRERVRVLQSRAGSGRGDAHVGPLQASIDETARRVAEREAALAEISRLAAAQTSGDATSRPAATNPGTAAKPTAAFVIAAPAGGQRYIVAIGRVNRGRTIALAIPERIAIARYWQGQGDAEWRFVPAGEAATERELAPAGAEFGDGRLIASEAGRARLRSHARGRMTLLSAVTIGSLGGWATVVLMMYRAIKRQREYYRLQQRFVADVSHELKTPLALIRLSAETLRDRRVIDPHRTHAYLDTIVREAERLTGLLDSILDFSRIESGQHVMKFRECDIGEIARQAWTLFEPQFLRDGFDARLELQPELPAIDADAQALQQVIVNLLQNAHRYSGEKRYVRLSVAREGFLIVITVEDRGIGMSRSQLDRLGDSFFRADDTRVRQQRGTGLGLAIVNHLITAHGGKMDVHSRPGEGSKFTVWIPFEPGWGVNSE